MSALRQIFYAVSPDPDNPASRVRAICDTVHAAEHMALFWRGSYIPITREKAIEWVSSLKAEGASKAEAKIEFEAKCSTRH